MSLRVQVNTMDQNEQEQGRTDVTHVAAGEDSAYQQMVCTPLRWKYESRPRGSEREPQEVEQQHVGVEAGAVEEGSEVERELTATERLHLLRQQEHGREQLEQLAQRSYRDNMQQYNEKLSKEPAHFDVPKISHTK